jgi:energy-coupling factor transporter ATPase
MIAISHLSHTYVSNNTLSINGLTDVSLNIHENEYIAVLGPNGSGKTTLARCLNGLLHPSSGHIWVDDFDATDPQNHWEVRSRVGMVFQNPDNQIVSVTVERELAFGLENLGLPSAEIQDRVERALQKFHLTAYRRHPPHRLSGGEKQRLAIASVMAMEPRYLILDEPTSLLDPRSRMELLTLLHHIHSEFGTTILHITQFPEEALRAQRLLILVNGTIEKDGDPESVFSRTDELARWGLEAPAAFRLNELLQHSGRSLPQEILSGSVPDSDREIKEDIQNQETIATVSLSEKRMATEHLCHTYDIGIPTESTALRDVSLGIESGECVAIIGPTGSGKTTLAEHLIGFIKPTSGLVFIDGIDIWENRKKMDEIRRKIGLVFQFPEIQFFEETVQTEVAFGPKQLDLEKEEIEERVIHALQLVGLEPDDFNSRSPRSLSAGEQRLVAIASILSMKPQILILDEPTAGLDPRGVARIHDLIRTLHESGMTILLISHHMDLVARVADRVIVLNEGSIALEGSPQWVFSHGKLLASIGLDIPEVAKILLALRERGWSVRTDIFTLEEATEQILAQQPPSKS